MKTTLYKQLHSQLIALLGMLMFSFPATAHEMHDAAYYANSSLYIMWHDLLHTIGAFFSQMSFGYIMFLTILLAILGYIAIKVKSTEHMMST